MYIYVYLFNSVYWIPAKYEALMLAHTRVASVVAGSQVLLCVCVFRCETGRQPVLCTV